MIVVVTVNSKAACSASAEKLHVFRALADRLWRAAAANMSVQGVDFSGEIALYDLIKTIRNRTGCGILLISHDLHVVMAETDTVICLNGHVCCRGTPQAVSQSPEYQRLFGVKAAQTLAVYNHDHDHTHLPDGRVLHADGSLTDHCHPDDGHHADDTAAPDQVHDESCGCGHSQIRLKRLEPGKRDRA